MTHKPSRFIIPSGTDITRDPDVLPLLPGRSFLGNKTPLWKTEVQEALSGKEYRRRLWTYPRWRFSLSHEFIHHQITNSDLERLTAFYNSHSGSYQEFLFFDPEDNVALDEPLGPGNGVDSTFQLTRTVNSSGMSFMEPIRALYGNPQIKLDGVSTTAFTMGEYGRVTFSSPPSLGVMVTWSGTFFFVCRFEEDELSISQLMSRLWSQDGLGFVSIKP